MKIWMTAAVVILLAPAFARAQPVADRVPANAMIYVGWQGSADPGPGYAQSNLKGFVDDSQLPDLVNQFLPAVMKKIGQINPQAGAIGQMVAAIARPSWEHPTAFFFAGVDMPQGGMPRPHLGVIWQPGADADALQKQLEQLVAQAQPPFPVKVVRAGQLVALMVGYDNAEAALGGGQTKALADDPAFKAAMGHLTVKQPFASAYVDYQKLWDLVDTMVKQSDDPDAEKNWPVLRDRVGLRSLKHLAAASGFDGKDWGTQAFVDAPQPRSGILKMAGGKPLGQEIFAAIPRNVTTAGGGHFNAAAAYHAMYEAVRSLNPNDLKDFDNVLEKVRSESGVDLEKDLLASLGEEWAYYADPDFGGRGLASLTLVNRLHDPAKFEQSMSKVEDYALDQIKKQADFPAMITLAFHTTQVDGTTIHYLGIPFVAPSWAVRDGNLYVSLFPQVAASAARHVAQKGPSILQNPGFAAVRDRLGQPNPGGFGFMDLPKTAEDAYGAWLFITRVSGYGDLFGVPAPPMVLPEFSKLRSHLSPAGSVSWADDEGFHVRSIEPFPGSTLIASDPTITAIYAEPALAISILLPALNRAREQANRVKSASNLRQIGMAAMLYANNHKDRFPPDLGTLLKEEDLTVYNFINPRTNTQPPPPGLKPDELAQWVNEHSDYVWLGRGKTAAIPPDAVLAYEKPETVTEGVNFLYGDGHVEFQVMPEAQEEIRKAREGKHAPLNGNL